MVYYYIIAIGVFYPVCSKKGPSYEAWQVVPDFVLVFAHTDSYQTEFLKHVQFEQKHP